MGYLGQPLLIPLFKNINILNKKSYALWEANIYNMRITLMSDMKIGIPCKILRSPLQNSTSA